MLESPRLPAQQTHLWNHWNCHFQRLQFLGFRKNPLYGCKYDSKGCIAPQLQSTAGTNCKLTADNLPGGELTTKSLTRQLGFKSRGVTATLRSRVVGVGVNRGCKYNMVCVVSQPPAAAEHGLLLLYSVPLDICLDPLVKNLSQSILLRESAVHTTTPRKGSRTLRTCPWGFGLWPGDS